MFCGYCGTELPNDAGFCKNCGKRLQKNGAPAPETPAKSAPAKHASKKHAISAAATRTFALCAMAVVLAVTLVRVSGARAQLREKAEAAKLPSVADVLSGKELLNGGQSDTGGQQQNDADTPQQDDSQQQSDADAQAQAQAQAQAEAEARARSEAMARAQQAAKNAFKSLSGTWQVQRYFDEEDREWKIYQLGERLFIAGYNFLNDVSYTTGGYNKIVGYEEEYTPVQGGWTCSACGTGKMQSLTGLDGLLAASSSTFRCDFCGHEEVHQATVERTPIYEYVPEEHYESHGQDMEYEGTTITISEDTVDMTGLGGTVYDTSVFHLETINGRDYLINDISGFAFLYDGRYLEYCEADSAGRFQGCYAMT